MVNDLAPILQFTRLLRLPVSRSFSASTSSFLRAVSGMYGWFCCSVTVSAIIQFFL